MIRNMIRVKIILLAFINFELIKAFFNNKIEMSEIVIVDPRLPASNDSSLVNMLKNLKENEAQAKEDSKYDLKRTEKFTDKKEEKKLINNPSFLFVSLVFLFVFIIAIIVRNFKLPKIIKYGLAALFVFTLLNLVHRLK